MDALLPKSLHHRMKAGRSKKSTRREFLPFGILMALIFFTLLVSLAVSVHLHVSFFAEPQVGGIPADRVARSYLPPFQDPERQPILRILRQAGYNFNDTTIFTPEIWDSLPRWSDVLYLYGRYPIIKGLETCEAFRKDVSNPSMRQMSVAGLFNSGTNILHSLLAFNCYDKASRHRLGMWQVPWGKHMPENQREKHWLNGSKPFNVSNVLPIVTVRDPYTWMQSMCRQAYAVQFDHSTEPERNLCPNLVPYEEDIRAHPRYKNKKYIPVHARFNKEVDVKFPSLAHLYNEWYNAYVNVTAYPRLMVRLEDVIFRADQVVPKICECFGGTWSRDGVHHRAKAANRNPGIDIKSPTSGLLGSIIKYGNRTLRRKHYQRIQFEAAKEILDPRLMELFGYSFEDP